MQGASLLVFRASQLCTLVLAGEKHACRGMVGPQTTVRHQLIGSPSRGNTLAAHLMWARTGFSPVTSSHSTTPNA